MSGACVGGRGLAPTPVRPEVLLRVCDELGITGPRVDRVVGRFRAGADLGFREPARARFSTNNRSATLHAARVSDAVQAEVEAGVTRGPYLAPPLPGFRVNPLSARIKDNGAARVILDLSAPRGDAVNDLINPDDCAVRYASLDELAAFIFEFGGAGTRIFKADIRNAFKLIPVRPDQHAALGFFWDGRFHYQTALPFGCRASPRIFNDFAELLRDATRALSGNGAFLNYLDDFFGVESGAAPTAVSTYQCFVQLCARVGVPLAEDKMAAPSTRVEILGIVVDTVKMTYELPAKKLRALVETLEDVAGKRCATRRQLLSVAGRLVHACKCVPPGRSFLRRILDAAYSVDGPLHWVRVTAAVRADLRWWTVFAPQWNGTFPILAPALPRGAGPILRTDSSRFGMGAVWGGHWWAAEWPVAVAADVCPSMTLLELLPILIAAVTWDGAWAGARLIIETDNMGVVGVWGRGWAREPRTMAVLRHLLFRAARGGYVIEICHVPGVENGAADALSRGELARFRLLQPGAEARPTPLPAGWVACVTDPVGSAAELTGVEL